MKYVIISLVENQEYGCSVRIETKRIPVDGMYVRRLGRDEQLGKDEERSMPVHERGRIPNEP